MSCFCLEGHMTDVLKYLFLSIFLIFFSIFSLHFPRLGIRPTYPPNKEALFCLFTGYTLYCNVVETILYWKIVYFFRNAPLSLLSVILLFIFLLPSLSILLSVSFSDFFSPSLSVCLSFSQGITGLDSLENIWCPVIIKWIIISQYVCMYVYLEQI